VTWFCVLLQELLGAYDTVYEAVTTRPFRLPKPPSSHQDKAVKRQAGGLAQASFSEDSLLLATKDEEAPCVAWIWDVQRLRLKACLVHKDPGNESAENRELQT